MRERSVSELLVDIGNSQIKWQVSTQLQSQQRGDWPEFQAWLAHESLDDIDQVLVASVKQESPLRAAMSIIFGQRLHWFDHSQQHPQLRHCYSEPQRLGVDRWLAMLGVIAMVADSRLDACEYLVIDAGTALTIDHIRYHVNDKVWHHLGGWIVPGQDLCQRALFAETDKVNRYQETVHLASMEEQNAIAFGQNTLSCVQQGAKAQQLAIVEYAARQNPAAQLIVTGGNGEILASQLRQRYFPYLIFAGLQLLCAPSS